MEFVRSFLRRHVEGKPVVASPNVGCFFRLASSDLCDYVIQIRASTSLVRVCESHAHPVFIFIFIYFS